MNDDERFLKDWLDDDAPDRADAREDADQIMARLPQTKQRSRWWPLLPSRRSQPRPSGDGQSPTINGRTRMMFSPVTAITTGAIVFAIGGALFIAQPLQQQGNVPGAESGEAVAPAWVTATVQFGGCDFGDTATEDGVTQERGMNCQGQTWTSDDPRLDGRANVAQNADSFDVDGQGYSLVTSVYEVITDEGEWRCTNADRVVSPAGRLRTTGVPDGDRLSCVGHGDNDGFSAVLIFDFTTSPKTVEGLIFPGEMPPMPALAAVE